MMIASSTGPSAFLALAFADLVILMGPLVLVPRPHDDNFIYGTVSFLIRVLWTWSFGLFTFANLVAHSVDSKP